MNLNDSLVNVELVNRVSENLKAQLAVKKGTFWARKCIYVSAMKSSLMLMDEELAKSVNNIMSLNLVMDMTEHYPDRDHTALLEEFMQDCEDLIDNLTMEAVRLGILKQPPI